MYTRVIVTNGIKERYIAHTIKLLINNDEIINLLKKHNAPKECIYNPFDMESCIPTRNYRYTDKYGNYWDNWIGKEVIIDL